MASAKARLINGDELEVFLENLKGRSNTSLRVEWTLSDKYNIRKCIKTVKICNIKQGYAPVDTEIKISDVPASPLPSCLETCRERSPSADSDHFAGSPVTPAQRPDAIAYEVEWFRKDILAPIGGDAPRHLWRVDTPSGSGGQGYSQYDCFMSMFPQAYLLKIVALTSLKLMRIWCPRTSPQEILRFFGVLVLCTRFKFRFKQSLWSTARTSDLEKLVFQRTNVLI